MDVLLSCLQQFVHRVTMSDLQLNIVQAHPEWVQIKDDVLHCADGLGAYVSAKILFLA